MGEMSMSWLVGRPTTSRRIDWTDSRRTRRTHDSDTTSKVTSKRVYYLRSVAFLAIHRCSEFSLAEDADICSLIGWSDQGWFGENLQVFVTQFQKS
jgi:hypothetical protein